MPKNILSPRKLGFPRPFDNSSEWDVSVSGIPQGKLARFKSPSGTGAAVLPDEVIRDIPVFGKLAANVEDAATKIAKNASETISSKIAEKNEPVIIGLKPSFLEARRAASHEADKIALDEATAIQLPSSYDNAIAGQVIGQWRDLKKGQKLEAVKDWPDFAIQAVARLGQHLSGLSEEEWDRVLLRRIRLINFVNSISPGNQEYAMKISAENPLARGLDPAKVSLEFDAEERRHEDRLATLAQAETMLQSVVLFASITLEKSVHEAFDILIGRVSNV